MAPYEFCCATVCPKGLLLYLVASLEDVYETEVEVCASPRTSVSTVACALYLVSASCAVLCQAIPTLLVMALGFGASKQSP
jgi:hypothetical protein